MILNEIKKILYGVNRKNKSSFIILVILLLFNSILEIVSISSIMPFMQSITDLDQLLEKPFFIKLLSIVEDRDSYPGFLGALSLSLIFLSSVVAIISNKMLLEFGNFVGRDMCQDLFKSYLYSPYKFHLNNSSSILSKNITQEVSRYTQNVLIPMLRLISKTIFLFLVFIVLLFLSWKITLSVFCIISLSYLFIFYLVKEKLLLNGKSISSSNKVRYKLISEAFIGIRETKLLSLEKFFYRDFSYHMDKIARATSSSQIFGLLPRSIIEFITFGGVVTTVLILYYRGSIIEYLPLLTMFLFVGYRALPSMQQIYSSLALIRSNKNSIDCINIEFDQQVSHKKEEQLKADDFLGISIKGLSYAYEPEADLVLKDISIKILKGQFVGLVGRSGSGKSTLLDILLGLLKPEEGDIVFNSKAMGNSNSSFKLFSYVPQYVHLVDDTILNNICLGAKNIDNIKLKKVCEIAHLDEFLKELDLGLDSIIGENGAQLSGGQRQRIGIARALYRDKEILVLDEATSSLDQQTEALIIENITKLGKTIIMVTHKIETTKKCDNIFVLEKGNLVGQGDYNFLCAKNSEFSRLISIESRGEKDE